MISSFEHVRVGELPGETSTAPTPVGSEPPFPREQSFVYTGNSQFFKTLENIDAGFAICKGVTQRVFDDIERERDRRRRHFRFHYRPDLRTLYTSVPSGPHERATAAMSLPISMASKRTTGFTGGQNAERFSSDNPQVPGSKEPNYSFSPKPSGIDDRWPTLVIETGYSESLARLKQDMHWWFAASQHAVKIVLLIKLDQGERRMSVYKYTEDWPPSPSQTMPQASSTRTNPVLRHTNIITPVENSFLQYRADRADLVLEFALLFRRQPDVNAGEADVVIPVDELEAHARDAWYQLGST